MSTTHIYVAFLRGINVGGHVLVKMSDLQRIMKELGYRKVKTILASGNVVFESAEGAEAIRKKIESTLLQRFKREISIIVRTKEEIDALIQQDPFQHIEVTPETRLYVTFLVAPVKSTLKIPYESPAKDFRILSAIGGEVCSVLVLTGQRGTTEHMKILEQHYGKQVTTRNWNTVLKVAKAMESSER